MFGFPLKNLYFYILLSAKKGGYLKGPVGRVLSQVNENFFLVEVFTDYDGSNGHTITRLFAISDLKDAIWNKKKDEFVTSLRRMKWFELE